MTCYVQYKRDPFEVVYAIMADPWQALPPPPSGHDWMEVPEPSGKWTLGIVNGEIAPVLVEAWVRAAKLTDISTAFAREVGRGCVSPKGRVDCDDTAQGRIGNVIQLRERAASAGVSIPETVTWTMLDKSQVGHNDADLVALGLAIGFGFAAKFAHKQALEAAVEMAAAMDDLEAIDIEAGWPA